MTDRERAELVAKGVSDDFCFWGASQDQRFKTERERCTAAIADAILAERADARREAQQETAAELVATRSLLKGIHIVAAQAVFRPMSEGLKDYQVADAVAEAVRRALAATPGKEGASS